MRISKICVIIREIISKSVTAKSLVLESEIRVSLFVKSNVSFRSSATMKDSTTFEEFVEEKHRAEGIITSKLLEWDRKILKSCDNFPGTEKEKEASAQPLLAGVRKLSWAFFKLLERETRSCFPIALDR